jgi:hypothetical protein
MLSKSAIALLAANVLTVAGVFLLDWDVAAIVILFWFENLVIGFWNVLKMIRTDNVYPDPESNKGNPQKFGKFPAIPFFVVHYGGFCLGHGIFLYSTLFSLQGFNGVYAPVGEMFNLIFTTSLVFAAGLLFMSHGYSYFVNYIGKKEYAVTNIQQLMRQPYGRIMVVHIFIFATTWFIADQHADKKILIVPLVAIKTMLDLFMHIKLHKKPGNTGFI